MKLNKPPEKAAQFARRRAQGVLKHFSKTVLEFEADISLDQLALKKTEMVGARHSAGKWDSLIKSVVAHASRRSQIPVPTLTQLGYLHLTGTKY